MFQVSDSIADFQPDSSPSVASWVTLVDGSRIALPPLPTPDLHRLQWEQEPAFAERIKRTMRGSDERQQVIRQAYETVCEILQEIDRRQPHQADFAMGMDPRYSQLVHQLLQQQHQAGHVGDFFELGFGSGALLASVSAAGYAVGGLEVAASLHEQAKHRLPPACHASLTLGNFLDIDMEHHRGRYSVAYWNDVFEHVPVDEIGDYVAKLHELLIPGGKLITITPNWHMRPSDVTSHYLPVRSEAVGFHLKEYTLREITTILRDAGFDQVITPTFITRERIHVVPGCHASTLKRWLEPTLEWLPFRLAVQVCRRFGFNCTIATRKK